MRTNIVLDDRLVEEGLRLTGKKTRKELVHLALEELVHSRRKRDLRDLAGQVQLDDDFDHKRLRELRAGAG